MILTVTLNPAIDKTYTLPGFKQGSVWRAQEVRALPGGKGLNVTRVLRTMGARVRATGFLAGHNGRWVQSALEEMEIASDFVWVDGETRLCLTIVDPDNRMITELRESGPTLNEHYLEKFRAHLASLLDQSKVVVFSGSLPPGLPLETYRVLVDDVRRAGKRTVLDTSGEAFATALCAHPDIVKPNRAELEAWWGRPCSSVADALGAAQELQRKTGGWAVVSLGEDGAVLCSSRGVWHAPALTVKAVNTVGCGDAMVAGLAMALVEDRDEEAALCLATALAASNAEHPEGGIVDPADVEEWAKKVRVAFVGGRSAGEREMDHGTTGDGDRYWRNQCRVSSS